MDNAAANRFATQWAEHWNSHDLEALLSHFSDDVLWTSPVAAQIVDGSGGNRFPDKFGLKTRDQRELPTVGSKHEGPIQQTAWLPR